MMNLKGQGSLGLSGTVPVPLPGPRPTSATPAERARSESVRSSFHPGAADSEFNRDLNAVDDAAAATGSLSQGPGPGRLGMRRPIIMDARPP